jgi:hypothetical protein
MLLAYHSHHSCGQHVVLDATLFFKKRCRLQYPSSVPICRYVVSTPSVTVVARAATAIQRSRTLQPASLIKHLRHRIRAVGCTAQHWRTSALSFPRHVVQTRMTNASACRLAALFLFPCTSESWSTVRLASHRDQSRGVLSSSARTSALPFSRAKSPGVLPVCV